MNIFKGLSTMQIVLIALSVVISSFLIVAIVSAVVSLLPITDNYQILVFFILGITCLLIGYLCLKSIKAKDQQNMPATNNPITPLMDDCSPANEINKNLSHTPNIPNKDMDTNSPPKTKNNKVINALLIMLTPFKKIKKFVVDNIKRQV